MQRLTRGPGEWKRGAYLDQFVQEEFGRFSAHEQQRDSAPKTFRGLAEEWVSFGDT
jgi:hypothetical protein